MRRREKRNLAVSLGGYIIVVNDRDDLDLMDELADEYKVLGEVCDDEEFGDNCTTDCVFYRRGTCSAEVMRDLFGDPIHVKRY